MPSRGEVQQWSQDFQEDIYSVCDIHSPVQVRRPGKNVRRASGSLCISQQFSVATKHINSVLPLGGSRSKCDGRHDVLFGHVTDQVHDAARTVPLVADPAFNLHDGGVQRTFLVSMVRSTTETT